MNDLEQVTSDIMLILHPDLVRVMRLHVILSLVEEVDSTFICRLVYFVRSALC